MPTCESRKRNSEEDAAPNLAALSQKVSILEAKVENLQRQVDASSSTAPATLYASRASVRVDDTVSTDRLAEFGRNLAAAQKRVVVDSSVQTSALRDFARALREAKSDG